MTRNKGRDGDGTLVSGNDHGGVQALGEGEGGVSQPRPSSSSSSRPPFPSPRSPSTYPHVLSVRNHALGSRIYHRNSPPILNVLPRLQKLSSLTHQQAIASPTHDYLEAFNSYPTSPDPFHTPIPVSPSHGSELVSPRSPNADEIDEKSGEFGQNRYDSSNLLKPSSYPSRGGRSGTYGSHNGSRNFTPLTVNQRVALRMAGKPKDEYKPPRGCVPTSPTKRRWLFFGVPIGLVIIAAAAVGIAVGVSKSGQNKTAGSSAATGGTGAGGSNSTTNGTTSSTAGQSSGGAASVQFNFGTKGQGADGSTVDMADGGSFTYSNAFGGTWSVDPDNPYGVSDHGSSAADSAPG